MVRISASIGDQPVTLVLPREDSWIAPELRSHGSWESRETSIFRRLLRPGDYAVDVGANIGWYALNASQIVGSEGRVWAFEPDPANVDCTRQNIEAFGAENVSVIQAAVWHSEQMVTLWQDPVEHGDHRTGWRPRKAAKLTPKAVPGVCLNTLLRRHQPIHVLKIDAQGAEGMILAGARQVLEESPNLAILFEFSSDLISQCGGTPDVLGSILGDAGYRLWAVWDQAAAWLWQKPTEANERDRLDVFPVEWPEPLDVLAERKVDLGHCNLLAARELPKGITSA